MMMLVKRSTNPSLIEALGSTDLNLLVDVGFNKEVAEDCALYWSCKPGSLARLIDHADKMSAEKIAEMGRKAKRRVAKEYTWDKICGQYEEIFKDTFYSQTDTEVVIKLVDYYYKKHNLGPIDE